MRSFVIIALFIASSSVISVHLRFELPTLDSEDIRDKVFKNIMVVLKDEENRPRNSSDKSHPPHPQDPCMNVYLTALDACRVATSTVDKSEENLLCVNWAVASHLRCYDSCLVDKLQCTLETRENARILHAIMSNCKPEVCAAFSRSAIDISSKFQLCFDTTPSCEDPQIIAFNFYRYGKKNFDLATSNVDDVLSSLRHLKNATLETAETLFNCSEDPSCIFKHTSHREAGKNNHKETFAAQNQTNNTATPGIIPGITEPTVIPNTSATVPDTTINQTNSTSLLEVLRPYPESFLQVTVRFIKSIFS